MRRPARKLISFGQTRRCSIRTVARIDVREPHGLGLGGAVELDRHVDQPKATVPFQIERAAMRYRIPNSRSRRKAALPT